MIRDEQLLIQKSLAGDQAATRKLYDRHEQYWFRICLRYGKNRLEAQDIFQEGVVKIFKVLDKYQAERGSFSAWSNRVLVNEALKYLKKHQWQQSFENLNSVEDAVDWSENIIGKITAKELTAFIQTLPTGYRLIFNMYVIEGYSHREIAETLNISVGTSKSQLSKAKKALQKMLNILL